MFQDQVSSFFFVMFTLCQIWPLNAPESELLCLLDTPPDGFVPSLLSKQKEDPGSPSNFLVELARM